LRNTLQLAARSFMRSSAFGVKMASVSARVESAPIKKKEQVQKIFRREKYRKKAGNIRVIARPAAPTPR
jgi:hypothetical protein